MTNSKRVSIAGTASIGISVLITIVLFLAGFTFQQSGNGSDLEWSQQPEVATSGQLIISEFRFRGPAGANDEFIEIYNNSGADHTVVAAAGTGYGIAASDGITRCTIPNGTLIPNKGHFLCVNSTGYSLASYPAGNGTTATGDATFTTNIPDNAGIAIFNNNVGSLSYSLANRLDAVGSTTEANTLYKEGTGYPALVPFSIDHAFQRDECGKGGSIINFGACVLSSLKHTDNNAADFIFVDTNGTSAGAGQRLGAPGPQNLSSPIASSDSSVAVQTLDPCLNANSPPNRIRDFTSDPPNNSTFGTIDLRRRMTNATGANITRMRYRIVDLATFPAPSGIADLRPRTSTAVVVTVDRSPCGTGTSNVTVQGTTLEQPPSQPNGGGFNSTLSSGTITLGTPLANGGSLDLRFLFGIQQTGAYKLGLIVETLPHGGAFYYISGSTENTVPGLTTWADFDGDRKTDIGIFRTTSSDWWIRLTQSGSVFATHFGSAFDVIAPADYTGDQKTDVAVFRPSNGTWYILRSENFSFYALPYGMNGDIPMSGDYDGDGIADPAVYRPSAWTWYVFRSKGGSWIMPFGNSTDKPVAADYDGDGKTDIAIYRPSASGAEWWIQGSSAGLIATQFGTQTDRAVPGDYTGDAKADIAFFRPSTGQWFVLRSENFSYYAFPWGTSGDLPEPGDYDGDGKYDAAVFRPSNATWYVNRSTSGQLIVNFGVSTDQGIPGAYVR
jgi:hypothetical protein